ncbi:PP2C family protein-serine/threonine phosphatase [Nonomuraea sp. NPDC050536]|uniref:PP2C family protein-serine/threonine phosphatase n=1 Tax=Nonomuraea sp. NPDC050536 TaxID=3364366 RepID=UPI0037CC2C00
MSKADGLEGMLTGLLQASHQASFEQLAALVEEHAAQAGLDEVLIYVADMQRATLRLMPTLAAEGPAAELRVDSTLAGRAFQEVRILQQGEHWWVPLLDGTERLGMLRVSGRSRRTPEVGRHLATLVALLLVSQRAHSDTYARLIRSRPLNVAAEMQWQLMPPTTFSTPEVTVGAVVEPAYEVGGDVYDYALEDDTLHLAVFDGMGHDVSAGLTANLAMASCRNNRRQGMDLIANSVAIEQVLIAEFGRGTRFVTAILADLDIRTGMLTWVNRGHPLPIVVREGRWSSVLSCPPAHPLGLDLDLPVTLCRDQLQPGDRLLIYTDGIVEAGAPQGAEFGLDRFVDFIIRHNTAELPVPETLRRLIRNVLDYHDGHLTDDATVLLVEWHGSAHEPLTLRPPVD